MVILLITCEHEQAFKGLKYYDPNSATLTQSAVTGSQPVTSGCQPAVTGSQ